ncbi:MAG: hypothetical protein ACR2FU_10625 [Streptosporangiaceae bacterium]
MTIRDYDPAATAPSPPLAIGVLVAGAVDLMQQGYDLPQPQALTVSGTQSISLLFASDETGAKAVARWAMRFGGVLTRHIHQSPQGPHLHCVVQFDYYGVRVEAYAVLPAETAT